jgi:RNA polymerase sigma factor (sigma-70 family)
MRSASTVLLRTQSDARLVALARGGHDRAFEAIVERYRRPLLRACRRILPEARAEDALQQALMAAWTALRRGDEVHDLRPWLYRIVRNTALNQLRVAGYDLDELVETLAATDDPEEEVERRALVRQTLTAVAALPERQRDALLRTAIEGRGQDEVARDLGLSDTALRQLVHRARVSVRAAATAVVPMPAAAWLAAVAPRAEPMAARIVELVAGSGAAGATLAKAGTVAVLAGGAVSAPALVDEHPARDRPAPRAEAARAPAAQAAQAMSTPEPSAKAGGDDTPAGGGRETVADRGDGERDEDERGGRRGERDHDDRGDRAGERDDDDRGGRRGDRDDGRDGDDDRDDDRGHRDDDSSGGDEHDGSLGDDVHDDSSTDPDDDSSGDDGRDDSFADWGHDEHDGSPGDDGHDDSFADGGEGSFAGDDGPSEGD